MRLSLLCGALSALVLAGCGGGDVSGDTPSGYATTEDTAGHGVSVQITPPGAAAGTLPVVKVIYFADGGRTFKSLPAQFKAIYESAANGKVTSTKTTDVDGADGAYLMTAELPGTGARPVAADVRNLAVRKGGASWVLIAERDPKAKGRLDADGVISSFKLGGGA
jgi:hypothetical protein